MIRGSTKSLAFLLPIVGSCALTAVILDQFLIASLLSEEHSARTFTIEAPVPGEKNAAALSNEVWVVAIVADGRILNVDALELKGRWELLWDKNYPTLVHRNDPGQAFISFQARNAGVRFYRTAWSGIATLRSDGDRPQTVDLYARQERPSALGVVAGPDQPPPGWTIVILLGVIMALAVWVQPWRSAAQERRWLTAYLTVIHLTVWATLWIGTNEDSRAYAQAWSENLKGNPHFFPPGYGMFLAFADWVPGMEKGSAATLLQHVMMIATLLWLHRIVSRLVPRSIAACWLVLTSALPPSLFLPQMIQSENLALFTMASALHFAHRAASSGGMASAVVSGASLGVGTLARAVPITMAPALLLVQFGSPQRRFALSRGVAILSVAVIVALLPAGWFVLHGNDFGLTNSSGPHLFNRAVLEQKLLDPSGKATADVLALLPGVELRDSYPWDLAAMLARKGLEEETANDLLGAVAREAILTKPTEYFWFSFGLAWRDLFADPNDLINWFARSPEPHPDLETPRPFPTTASGIRARANFDWIFAKAWVPLCWMAVIGALSSVLARRRILAISLAWVPVGYLVACGFVQYFLARYNVAVTPFVTATAMIPIGIVTQWLGWTDGEETRKDLCHTSIF